MYFCKNVEIGPKDKKNSWKQNQYLLLNMWKCDIDLLDSVETQLAPMSTTYARFWKFIQELLCQTL